MALIHGEQKRGLFSCSKSSYSERERERERERFHERCMGEQLYFQITDKSARPLLEKLYLESVSQLKELDPSIYNMMRSLLNYKTL